jgi:3-amino-5-hydroxybenzoate synthase
MSSPTESKAENDARRMADVWPQPTKKIEIALNDVLFGGNWWQSGGGACERLERWLADSCNVRRAVTVANGTVGLELTLSAYGFAAGSDVLVPGVTFISSASAVWRAGLRPVPVDVDADTLTLDVSAAKALVTSRTRAIMPVHLAGLPADMNAVCEFADAHDLAVIEDAAQAIGASWNGRACGSIGDAGVFSFQAAKLLPGGEGGAILSDDDGLMERVELLANCGRKRGSHDYEHLLVGTNGRMGEFQAAIVMAQVDEFEELSLFREAIYARLAAACAETGWWIQHRPGPVSRHGCYMVLLRGPAEAGVRPSALWLAEVLRHEGLPARPLYPPFYRTGAFATVYPHVHCPAAEQAASEVVCLPHQLLLHGEHLVAKLLDTMERISAL